MPTYGVTPEGFVRPTVADIIDAMEQDQRTEMYEDLDVSAESIVGQLNGVYGNQLGEAWEALEDAYNGFDPDASGDRQLDNLSKITGTVRRGDTYSKVTLACALTGGTELVAGTHFAAITDMPDVRWTPIETFEAPSDGMHNVVFRAESAGPVDAAAGTITTVATPLVGWSSVNNPLDADPGERVETDFDLRFRREREIATMGTATVRAIKANVSQAFPELEALEVYENDTDYVDADGRPPHCIEVLFYDVDPPPSGNNDRMAKAIFESKAGGIATFGNASGTVTYDDNGETKTETVRFSRAIPRLVYVEIDLVKAAKGYPSDAVVAETVASLANRGFTPGDDVTESFLYAAAFGAGGVFKITAVRLGLSPSPVGSADIAIGLREVARFDSGRITVTST